MASDTWMRPCRSCGTPLPASETHFNLFLGPLGGYVCPTRPVRIQRQRTKGWRMPPNTVYVGRPSRWGNGFRPTMFDHFGGQPLGVERAVELYRLATLRFIEEGPRRTVRVWLAPLRGKNLACWCPLDQPCHADVLLELANA